MPRRPPCEAVLFDFDGVLAHLDVRAALEAAASHHENFAIAPDRILSDYFHRHPQNTALDLGLTTIEEVRESMRPLLWHGSRDAWHAWWRSVEDAYVISDEMAGWITSVRRRCRVGLVTDNHRGFREWLDRLDGEQLFDAVVCSAEHGLKKPSRELFEIATSRLRAVFDRTAWIDDDRGNVDAMRAAGMAAIHYASLPQARRELDALLDPEEESDP